MAKKTIQKAQAQRHRNSTRAFRRLFRMTAAPFGGSKNKRTRVDYEFDPPMTLEKYQIVLDSLPNQTYWDGSNGDFEITKIHTTVIYTENNRSMDKIEVTVYMEVDVGDKIND